MKTDALVFAAHPDDAELAMSGTIAKLTKNGLKVGIIDLTRGELGSRGSVDIRQKEASLAAKILKVSLRENLLIPDGDIERKKENLVKIITSIRKYKPKIIFAPYFNDRHPDHIHTSRLVKEAMFATGLYKLKTYEGKSAQNTYRPMKLFYYMQTYQFEPSFIVDISDCFEIKMKAVLCFKSQFHNPESKEPETFISRPEFIHHIESRAEVFGFQIGKKYGEAFFCEEKIELNLVEMLKR
jgi:bacillithiol biosynthesis deacetylase BshB1